MGRLFGRIYELRFGQPGQPGRAYIGNSEGGLELSFEVTKTARRSANKCKLTIYNLADAAIGALEETGTVIQLLAGYESNAAVIFSGSVARRGVVTEQDGHTRTTTVDAGDGELELQRGRSDLSLAPGSTTTDALNALAGALGVGRGNIDDLPAKELLGGYVHTGQARDALTEICRDIGRSWSIQNGELVILSPNEVRAGEVAVLLSQSSGLVGVPKRTKEGVELTSLLQPRLIPGGLVQVESRALQGAYKIIEVQHAGGFRQGDWYSNIKAKERK